LIGVLQDRVQAFTESGDADAVLAEAALIEAQGLAALLTSRPEDYRRSDVEALNVLGWLYWCRYEAVPSDHRDDELATCLGIFSSVLLAAPEVEVPDPVRERLTQIDGLPETAAQVAVPATALVDDDDRSGDLALLDVGIFTGSGGRRRWFPAISQSAPCFCRTWDMHCERGTCRQGDWRT
jgi:hypothetical protein